MQAMTMEQVKAVGLQGWAVRRNIHAELIVQGQAQKVRVIGTLRDGALVACMDGRIANRPIAADSLKISQEDAAHLDGVWADVQAQRAGRFFSGGSASMDHRTNWGAGSRAR